jgi:hypothetical protein
MRQTASDGCHHTVNTPTPVVTRWRTILKGISGIGKTVVEGTDDWRGGISGGMPKL